MYVTAPYRGALGSTAVNRTISARIDTTIYPTKAAALAKANIMNQSASVIGGRTTRSVMQSGRVGPSRFVDTDYSAVYQSYKSSGVTSTVSWTSAQTQFWIDSFPIGLGYSGFNNTGHLDNLGDLNPSGVSGSAQAVYNRLVIGNLSNRIKTELVLKAVDTDFDAAEALTGLKPAVRLVTERAIQVSRAFMAVRKGNVQKALDVLGLRRRFHTIDKASIWLELQYGWLPLLNDIFDGADEIREVFSPDRPKVDLYTVTRTGSEGLMVRNPGANAEWTNVSFESKGTVQVKAKLRYTVTDSFVAYMSQLGLSNPAYIAWTALPYSFVVDWLAPVGDMLRALHAPVGLGFNGGYMTVKSYGTTSAVGKGHKPFQALSRFEHHGTATAEAAVLYINRTAFIGFPGLAPYVKFPFSSPTRIANAISLIEANRKYR
jgi:hypothetical protein